MDGAGGSPIRILRPVLALFLVTLVGLAPYGVAPSAEPTFLAPVTLPRSANFGEPSIAAHADGTLYVTAPGSRSALWRSDDAGLTWARVADSLGASGDSDVAIDANGRVYVSDLFRDVPVSVSTDRGQSFAFAVPTSMGGSIDRQWLAASGNGKVWSVWRDGSTERIAISEDGGVTYRRAVVATGVGLQGNVLATSDMDLWIPYTKGGDLWLAKSTDGGSAWTSVRAARGVSSLLFPAVALDAAGVVYVAFADGDGVGTASQARVEIVRSFDGGRTFDAPVTLSAPGTLNVFPWIVAGDAGRVGVAWLEGQGPHGVVVDPNVAPLTTWRLRYAFSEDAASAEPSWQVLAPAGVVHVGPICTMGTGCLPVRNPVAGNRMLLDFFEMAMMPDGRVAIAYAADSTIVTTGTTTTTVLRVAVQGGGPDLRS